MSKMELLFALEAEKSVINIVGHHVVEVGVGAELGNKTSPVEEGKCYNYH